MRWLDIQNRTDLSQTDIPAHPNPGRIVNYTLSPNAFVPALIDDDYRGEVIPPYACMRIAGAPTLYKDGPCWPVCLPDDQSEMYQEAGIHLFNGNQAIPLGGFGKGTQDYPAKVLFDYSAPAGGTYGTTYADAFSASDANLWVGGEMAIRSGSWALQSVGNMVSDFQQGGILPFTYWPYTLMGLDPQLDPGDPSGLTYPRYLIWVNRGAGVQITNDSQLALQIANLNTTILTTTAGL